MAHDFHNHGNLCYNAYRKGGGVPLTYKEAIIELVERYIVKNPQEDIQIRFVSVQCHPYG